MSTIDRATFGHLNLFSPISSKRNCFDVLHGIMYRCCNVLSILRHAQEWYVYVQGWTVVYTLYGKEVFDLLVNSIHRYLLPVLSEKLPVTFVVSLSIWFCFEHDKQPKGYKIKMHCSTGKYKTLWWKSSSSTKVHDWQNHKHDISDLLDYRSLALTDASAVPLQIF